MRLNYRYPIHIKVHASADTVVDLEKLVSQIVIDNATKQERPPFLLRVQQDILDKLTHDGQDKVNLTKHCMLTVLGRLF